MGRRSQPGLTSQQSPVSSLGIERSGIGTQADGYAAVVVPEEFVPAIHLHHWDVLIPRWFLLVDLPDIIQQGRILQPLRFGIANMALLFLPGSRI
jgi:hypothetical protein